MAPKKPSSGKGSGRNAPPPKKPAPNGASRKEASRKQAAPKPKKSALSEEEEFDYLDTRPRVKRSAAPRGPVSESVPPSPPRPPTPPKVKAVPPPPPPPPPPPAPEPEPEEEAPASPLPQFVREASPAQRKAAVEALAMDAGVAPILARAPWRKPEASKAAPQAPAAEAPKPATPLRMTKPPEERPAPRVGVTAKRPVILDTNALMMQFQFHIDVERELRRLLDFGHEIVVPSVVVEELENLAKEAKGKDAGEARMALELSKTFRIVESPGGGDTSILRLAQKLENAIVVTNDKLLRARLRAKDIPNIYMRSSAFLTIEGHVSGT